MSRTLTGFALGALLCAVGFDAAAQQAGKVRRIGMLVSGTVATHGERIDAFRQGLRDLGYVEGKNLVIEYIYAAGKPDQAPDFAAEMIGLKPEVIFVSSTALTAALKKATSTIPVVATAGDLVGDGIVSSLARPGGNITGSTSISPDLSGKRLELLREAAPKTTRVALLWYPGRDQSEVKETEVAARILGVSTYSIQVRATEEFAAAFASIKKENANALVIIQGSFFNSRRKQVADFAIKDRLPSISEAPDYAIDGCLMSYGPNLNDLWRRGAIFVDKILKGAKPADLPVEQPTKFEFVINLKTAKALNLMIPQSVLFRADKVIK